MAPTLNGYTGGVDLTSLLFAAAVRQQRKSLQNVKIVGLDRLFADRIQTQNSSAHEARFNPALRPDHQRAIKLSQNLAPHGQIDFPDQPFRIR